MNLSSYENQIITKSSHSHVTCFSNSIEDQKPQTNLADDGLMQENKESEANQNYEIGMRAYEDHDFPIGPVDLDCLWNY